jgi:hypothetical protein
MQYPSFAMSFQVFPVLFCLFIAALALYSMVKTNIGSIVYETPKKSKAKS